MKFCPKCGEKIADEAKFCLYCMTPLNEKTAVVKPRVRRFPVLLVLIGAAILIGGSAAALGLSGVFTRESADPAETTPAETGAFDAALPETQTEPPAPSSETAPPETAGGSSQGGSSQGGSSQGGTSQGGTLQGGSSQGGSSQGGTSQGGNETHTHTIVTDPAVPATCAAAGLTEGSHCSVCGEILIAQKTVAKTAHKAVTDPAVPATCTATGLTEGSHCSVCGTVFTAQKTVAKIAHSYTEATYTAPATCVYCGATTGTCLAAPYLEFTLSSKPPRKSNFNGNLYIHSVDSIEKIYNGDGTYTVKITVTVKNNGSAAYTGGIPAKYAYIGTEKEADDGWGSLAPGETGQLGAVFYNVPGGYYYLTI